MQRSRIHQIALIASLTLLPGCGGAPSEVDTAETIRLETAKPTPDPTKPIPETAKDAPAPAPKP